VLLFALAKTTAETYDFPRTRAALEGREVVRPLEVRATDLYAVRGQVQPGIVLIGDAFQASCPSSGSGVTRILNDIERLTQAHIPDWFATPGVEADKIAAFYGDPVKQAVDNQAMRGSLRGRSTTLAATPYWRARRAAVTLKRAFEAARARRR